MFTLSHLASSVTRLGSALTKMASMRYLAVFALAGVSTVAQAAFVSAHQFPLKIALPPTGQVYPTDTKIGFKQQYAPEGVSGCAIGFTRTGCAFPGGGSLSLPEYTGYQLQSNEFKIYIPAGTKSVMFTGYAPQRAIAAFALRYGSAPVRTSGLSNSEYQQAQSNERIDTSFATLVNTKTDQLVVHDGGGTLRFLGGQMQSTGGSTTEGNWLYVRQVMGTPLYDIQVAMDVDMPKYAAGFAKITWTGGSYPDPVDAPSPGGTTNPGTGTTPGTPNPANNVTLGTVVSSSASQALKLDITLTQSAPNVAANPKVSVWIAVYLPRLDQWYFRRSDNSWTTDTSNIDAASYYNKVPNVSVLKITPSLQFTASDLSAEGAQVYFGYQTGSGPFINKGKVWPK